MTKPTHPEAVVTPADPSEKGPRTPIDGWLRNQQETLPMLDAECEEMLVTLDRSGEAVRAAHETVKRTAAALGITLPSQKKKGAEPKSSEAAP